MPQQSNLTITDAVNSYIKLHRKLMKDFAEVSAQLVESDTPFARRNYIRHLFTLVEGETYIRKQIAIALYEACRVDFSRAELSVLYSEQYSIDKGKAKARTIFFPYDEDMRFSFEAFAKACRINYKLDCGGIGWKSFVETRRCRDRLTHPKNSDSLIVNDEDKRRTEIADKWYVKSSEDLVNTDLP
jgi:hypothetical protein